MVLIGYKKVKNRRFYTLSGVKLAFGVELYPCGYNGDWVISNLSG